MAQLPPKAPSMAAHNWPFQMIAPPPPPQNNNSWVDEFLEFSSARRSNHRRSASCDSIAFVEAPLPFAEQCRNSINNNPAGFEGLDDEQLRNMFSDDIGGGAASNPSTPSDQNSDVNNDGGQEQYNVQQPKNEPGETQMHSPSSNGGGSGGDTAVTDPKRIKRILANRQSAQRSRVRKLQYISELERSVTTLQTEVSVLSPRVAFLDHQRLILNVDNSALKQRIAALAQDKIFKDAHQEALRKEIERLRQIYHDQTVKRMANKNNDSTPTQPPAAPPASQPQPSFNNGGCTDQ